jgi:hypothetical protein
MGAGRPSDGVHPSGRSLLTSTYANRSNVWVMTGIELPEPWWRSLLPR